MSAFEKHAEEKIRDAILEGHFDALPGFGQPLRLDDDPRVPRELQSAYRILRNAGCLPEELELRKERLRLEDLLAVITDDDERERIDSELRRVALRYELLMEKRGIAREYRSAVLRRLS